MNKLFYVIGASGAGKDTLMNYARTHINGSARVIFAHRYITRPPFAGNENHIYLTTEEFKERAEAGLFVLHWNSHDKFYGIGIEINSYLNKGFSVVVNGSREYLPVARQLYPGLVVIMIDASPEIISSRLANRGRESGEEIKKRIARTAEINAAYIDNCIIIMNDGKLEDAGDELINTIALKQSTLSENQL